MSSKKYLSLDGLTEYDALIKQEIMDSIGSKVDKNELSTVATSGSYSDLSDKPVEYTDAQIQEIWDTVFI